MELDRLKSVLDEVRARFHVPSYSATVRYQGKFYSLSGGARDLEEGTAPDDQTLYAIGSCTKSFTAGALCVLIDRGLAGLDTPVKEYVPEFEMADSYVADHLTVRDMLCHRCGLPRHELAWYSRLDTLTMPEIVKMFRFLKPNQPFRYRWQYNNQMYALAGEVIRRVTGKHWSQVVREELFQPLGITRAAFTPGEAQAMGNCAQPYLWDKKAGAHKLTPFADIGEMGAAGTIFLSTAELAKWDAMLIDGGKFNGRQILSPEICAEMTGPQMLRPKEEILAPMEGAVSNMAYGLGLMTEVFQGHRLVHHGGHIDGFMADQSFLPDDDFTCSILTNVGEIRGAMVMRYAAMECFLGGGADWSATLEQFFDDEAAKLAGGNAGLMEKKPQNAPCPVALSAIAGTYREPGYGAIDITAEDDCLKLALGTLTLTGRHYANQYFYLEEPHAMPGVLIEAAVDIDAQGQVVGFSAGLDVEGPEKIHFTRQ